MIYMGLLESSSEFRVPSGNFQSTCRRSTGFKVIRLITNCSVAIESIVLWDRL